MKAADRKRQREDDLRRREAIYVAWLMDAKGLTMAEGVAYAQGGQAALDKLRRPPQRVRSVPEKRAGRRADMSESDRRWERIQQPCGFKGCSFPVNHSGPHKVAVDLDGRVEQSIDALDRRER